VKDATVGDLSPADLELQEDGQVARIQEVRKLSRAPLRYCVLFDASNSERDRFELQQLEVRDVLGRIVAAGTDRGWLVLFNQQIRESDETSNPLDIINVISRTKPSGATSLYDAVQSCANRMLKGISDQGLRAMFLFSDGEENQSNATQFVAIETALRAGVRIYAFGPEQDRFHRGIHFLRELAQTTGGRVYWIWTAKQIASAVGDLGDELRSPFVVVYSVADRKSDGRVHKLTLKSRKKGLTVLAPTEYYAPKP